MKKIFTLIALAMLCSVGINAEDVWTIVGNKAIMNGNKDWQVDNADNDMATADGGATYTLTVTDKTLEANKAYEYKAAKGHAWDTSVPQSGNQSLTVTENGIYTIVYTLTPATNTLTAEATKTGDAGEVTHTYSIAGDSADLFGAEWSETNTATDMTLVGGIYTWTKEDVTLPAGTIKYKVVEDHAWGISYGNNGADATIVIEGAGSYDVTITFNPETKAVNGVATKKGSVEVNEYYLKSDWQDGTPWTWVAMTKNDDGTFSLKTFFTGDGCNHGFTNSGTGSWMPLDQISVEEGLAKGDPCVYTVTISGGAVTISVTKDQSATEYTFTVNITGCDEGYAIFGGETYKDGDTFKSASESPKVDAGHIIGYAVTAPVIDGTNVNVTYEEVGTVEVTVNVTNNTGDALSLFACEGLTWANLNDVWPGSALVDNSATVTMTKDDYLHMILTGNNGSKKTDNIGGEEGIKVSDNTTIAITVEAEGNAYAFTIDNIATAIANVSAPAAQTMSIYSISGQRLQKAQRGLNIINGKKVVVM